MTKTQLIKHAPNLKNYQKEYNNLLKDRLRVDKELNRLGNLLSNLEGVEIYNSHPICCNKSFRTVGSEFEVWSKCQNVNRTATVLVSTTQDGYFDVVNENNDSINTTRSKRNAVKAAKEYVSNGQH